MISREVTAWRDNSSGSVGGNIQSNSGTIFVNCMAIPFGMRLIESRNWRVREEGMQGGWGGTVLGKWRMAIDEAKI